MKLIRLDAMLLFFAIFEIGMYRLLLREIIQKVVSVLLEARTFSMSE